MKHMPLGEVVKEVILGEGYVALLLIAGAIALGLFPLAVVVYIFYIFLLGYVEDQTRRWLRKFLTSWPRLAFCTAFSIGCVVGAWQLTPPNPSLFATELHPLTFSFWTLMLTGVWVFWLCVGAAKELWQSRKQ